MQNLRFLAGTAVITFTLMLAACGSEGEPGAATPSSPITAVAPTPTPTATPAPIKIAKDLTGITVTGEDNPELKVPAPWGIEKTTVKVLKEGASTQVVTKGYVKVNYLGVNGRTGEVFDASYGREPADFDVDGVVPGFKTALVGQKVGSRVLVAMTSQDGYPEGNPQAGIEKGDTLVFVLDILAAQFDEPQGTTGTLPATAPQVSVGASGPTAVIPAGLSAPTALGSYELIKGTGPVINAESGVMVRFRSFTWDGKVFEDSWSTVQSGKLSNAIQGWQDGMVGKTAGSRLVLTIPPALAYPEGRTTEPTLAPNQALIYVVDVLYIG